MKTCREITFSYKIIDNSVRNDNQIDVIQRQNHQIQCRDDQIRRFNYHFSLRMI